jgi:hypothetical protein
MPRPAAADDFSDLDFLIQHHIFHFIWSQIWDIYGHAYNVYTLDPGVPMLNLKWEELQLSLVLA